MNKKIQKNILMCFFIILGIVVIITSSKFPKNPGGIGPSFFPTIVSVMLIIFSVLEIFFGIEVKDEDDETALLSKEEAITAQGEESDLSIVDKETPEEATKNARIHLLQMIMVVVALIALVLIMEHINIILGIVLFLLFYLIIIAKIKPIQSVLISVIGTGLVYLMIILLQIPM